LERWDHLIQIRKVTDFAILLGVSKKKIGNMQRLARKQVLQWKGLREKFTMQRLEKK
jgi:hypothetical protein